MVASADVVVQKQQMSGDKLWPLSALKRIEPGALPGSIYFHCRKAS